MIRSPGIADLSPVVGWLFLRREYVVAARAGDGLGLPLRFLQADPGAIGGGAGPVCGGAGLLGGALRLLRFAFELARPLLELVVPVAEVLQALLAPPVDPRRRLGPLPGPRPRQL